MQGLPEHNSHEACVIWCFIHAEVTAHQRSILQSSVTEAWLKESPTASGLLINEKWLTGEEMRALTEVEANFVSNIARALEPPVPFTVLKQFPGQTMFVPAGFVHCVYTMGHILKIACESYDLHRAAVVEHAAQLPVWTWSLTDDYMACQPSVVSYIVEFCAGLLLIVYCFT